VEVIGRGSRVDEAAATLRRHVRDRVHDLVGRRSPQSAAIVVAVLIGDRAGLTEDVERRLQEAGTYHVIAISGGNIAVFTVCLLGLGRVLLLPWRTRLAMTAVGLLAYGEIASGGSSVSRAVAVALVYLGGCAIDQRGSAASALGVAALVLLCAAPLSLVDAGFLLTFGATIAILTGVPRALARWPVRRWSAPVALVAASAASELALLPVGAHFFARVTLAGLLLNLAAVPLMSVVQVGGLLVLLLALVHPAAAHAAAWVPHLAAEGLVRSAALVDHAPWLTWRVPPPPWWLMGSYYVLGLLWLARHRLFRWMPRVERLATAGLLGGAATGAAALVLLAPVNAGLDTTRGRLRVTVLDVGQGDATLVQTPDGRALLVDAGGLAGGARFDIGERVVAPAVWHRGVRRLEAVVVTHGDPDHAGGVPGILDMIRPRELWDGIPVSAHPTLVAIDRAAARRHVVRTRVHAGDAFRFGAVSVEVLHPSPPDWERRRVRNDDSVVLDVRLGAVSIVLTGDISGEVEESLVPRLRPADVRVLKVSHHGSATSTSAAFVGALRPRVAIVSCGRGNRFGHPAPVVIDRLESAGSAIYRTDRDGAVTLETDGKTVRVKTAM
jgi:competence protein ComEC